MINRGAAAAIVMIASAPVQVSAQTTQHYEISEQELAGALKAFAAASGREVIAPSATSAGKRSRPVRGMLSPEQAMFPQTPVQGGAVASVAAARSRLDTARSALQHTLGVQAQVVGNVQADAQALSAIVARSQGAEGALQVGQATNQLLALTAKQQFQIQNMMAAQYRADAIEQARRVQAEADARVATTRFLGSGSAYSQLPPGQ